MDLALFDFDGTITTRGTYLDFIRFAVSRRRQFIGTAALSPCIAAYRMGLLPELSLRPLVARVAFGGSSEHALRVARRLPAQLVRRAPPRSHLHRARDAKRQRHRPLPER